jgi:hypothetical protein
VELDGDGSVIAEDSEESDLEYFEVSDDEIVAEDHGAFNFKAPPPYVNLEVSAEISSSETDFNATLRRDDAQKFEAKMIALSMENSDASDSQETIARRPSYNSQFRRYVHR